MKNFLVIIQAFDDWCPNLGRMFIKDWVNMITNYKNII